MNFATEQLQLNEILYDLFWNFRYIFTRHHLLETYFLSWILSDNLANILSVPQINQRSIKSVVLKNMESFCGSRRLD